MKLTQWSEQLLTLMMNTDRKGADQLIKDALAEGISPNEIIHDILDPALINIGCEWEKMSVSMAQTFVSAKIAEDILLLCLPAVEKHTAVSKKGPIVIGNIEDDFHSLGRKIVNTFLSAEGWEVHDLGNDVSAEVFVDTAQKINASVIGVSAMMQTTALGIRKIRDLINQRNLESHLKLAVGGAIFNWYPDLVKEVGADGTTQHAAGANDLFTKLHSEARKDWKA